MNNWYNHNPFATPLGGDPDFDNDKHIENIEDIIDELVSVSGYIRNNSTNPKTGRLTIKARAKLNAYSGVLEKFKLLVEELSEADIWLPGGQDADDVFEILSDYFSVEAHLVQDVDEYWKRHPPTNKATGMRKQEEEAIAEAYHHVFTLLNEAGYIWSRKLEGI